MNGCQKIIRIIGVLFIIAGIIYAISGMIAASVCTVVNSPDIVSHIEGYPEDTGFRLFGIFDATAAAGIFDTVTGILSVRAADDADNINPVCVVSMISLVLGIGYAIFCAMQNSVSAVIFAKPVLSAILIYCALSIMKQKAAEGPKRESDARFR